MRFSAIRCEARSQSTPSSKAFEQPADRSRLLIQNWLRVHVCSSEWRRIHLQIDWRFTYESQIDAQELAFEDLLHNP